MNGVDEEGNVIEQPRPRQDDDDDEDVDSLSGMLKMFDVSSKLCYYFVPSPLSNISVTSQTAV